MSAQVAAKILQPSTTNGHSLITVGGIASWGNDFINQDKFTTGSFYAGSNATNGEQSGSHVAVSAGSTALRGLITAQHSTDVNAAVIFSQKSRGTRAAPTTVAISDGALSIVSSVYDGANYLRSAQILFTVIANAGGSVGANDVAQQISFLTGVNNAPTERLAIYSVTPTGRLGTILISSSPEITGVLGIHGTGIATPIATVGDLRMRANSTIMSGRNAANNANNDIINSNGSNDLTFGNGAQCPIISLNSTTTFQTVLGANIQFTVNVSRVEITRPVELSFNAGVASPRIIQQTIAAANGQNMWIHAQSPSSGNQNGGSMTLSGGAFAGTGSKGSVRMALNADETLANVQVMVVAADLGPGRRVVGLVTIATLSSTQMPANSGDGVVFIADAQTEPTADAVGGHIYYSSAGRPVWRITGGTVLALSGTAATANAGAGALPATPEAFLTIVLNGTTRKIPYYVN
jgi:hypothetical protein